MKERGSSNPRIVGRRPGHGRLRRLDLQRDGDEDASAEVHARHRPLVRILPGADAHHRILSGRGILRSDIGFRPLDRIHPARINRYQHGARGAFRRGRGFRSRCGSEAHADAGDSHEHRCARSGDIPGDDGGFDTLPRGDDRPDNLRDKRRRGEDRQRVRRPLREQGRDRWRDNPRADRPEASAGILPKVRSHSDCGSSTGPSIRRHLSIYA